MRQRHGPLACDALGRQVNWVVTTYALGDGVYVPTTTDYLNDRDTVLIEEQRSTVTVSYTEGNAPLCKDGEMPLFGGLGSGGGFSISLDCLLT